MLKICSVPGCESGKYQDRKRRIELGLQPISLFAVPKSDDRLKAWENALKQNLNKTQHICHLHFADEHIRKNYKIKLPDGSVMGKPFKRWLLVDDAIPTLPNRSVEQSENNNVFEVDTVLEQHALQDCSMKIVDDEIIEPAENVTLNGNRIFSIDDFKSDLSSNFLPEYWTWSQQGSDALFTYLDRSDMSIRLHLVVHEDLSIQIRSITNRIVNLEDNIGRTADILQHMNVAHSSLFAEGRTSKTKVLAVLL
ncbi:uncharacterized protein [Venturia canescens]|uniref:uncharacterized protein isoform X2 n=1 Tax=Venturia canescens TaxID=32260 RepID=UPI001C9BDBED|nr:uncharacterized protein LOC122406532 isoform X2 [Venturia canescens]